MMQLLDFSSIEAILEKRLQGGEKKLSDIPHPSLLHDGEKTAKRLARAIRNKEKITLIGDYDVDGVISTAIVVDFFRQIDAQITVIIPNRFRDGYGVNATVLERVDADVILTVDNGITATEAADICLQRGIDLLITDHHTPPKELPKAYSIVDPKLSTCQYPFKEICGAEVIWLVLALVKKELGIEVNMRNFVDLLAIAIIADIMPLVDINRTLVKDGLKALMTSSRPASIIIRDFLNKKQISSEDIAFMIAPRLNAAGRLEDASLALSFITATSTQEAYKAFEKLCTLNDYRKEIEAKVTKEAIEMVNEDDAVIVVAKEGWHEGVVGIVASRLVEHFSKPAIVLSINDTIAKGSARSLGEVDIFELISKNKEYLTKFGGHKMAAGLSLEEKNIASFKEAINKDAKQLPKEFFVTKENILGILDAKAIGFELLELLEKYEPYGEGNERPRFLAKEVPIEAVRTFGADNTHCRLKVRFHPHDTSTHELVLFRQVLTEQKQLTCSFSVNKNEFNNNIYLQLLINKIYN